MRSLDYNERAMMRDAIAGYLNNNYTYESYRNIIASDNGWSSENWREFKQLGWLGLPFSLRDGGLGGSPTETSILMEQFGRSLVVEPYLTSVILAGGLIAALGAPDQRKALLFPLLEGDTHIAFAHDDERRVIASKLAGGFEISGVKRFVLGAPSSNTLLVSAQVGNRTEDKVKLGVFALSSTSRGVALKPFTMLDGRRAATVELNSVKVANSALLGGNEDAGSEIKRTIDHAIAALSADAVGAIAKIVEMTVRYSKIRNQFGRSLSKFQSIQSILVRMKVMEEEARAMSFLAASALDEREECRARAISGAKAKIGACGRFVHQSAIQVHGAIGTTDELPLGAYVKRLLVYEGLFGTSNAHLLQYAGLLANSDKAN